MAFDFQPGWLGIDDQQRFLAAERPELAAEAPGLVGSADPTEPILLYQAFRDVLGGIPQYPAQEIGDCVGVGHGHAVDLLQCVEIALGAPTDYRETSTEFIYAASRQVAGLLGRGDGSYGAAAVKALTEIGAVSREHTGKAYSGQVARSWGHYGPPAALTEIAGNYRLGSAARVTTWAELTAAVSNGYPVTICSSQGFTETRDAQGFCLPRGRWDHCMVIVGLRFDRPGACVLQSWGPHNPTGPTALGQPGYSFWADRSAVEGILRQGDSWALAKAPAFAPRELPAHWKYSAAA